MTDKKFREWITRQPSCLSGMFSEYLESGEGRCIAAHVRRASNSGTAYKPQFSCVPLTDEEHRYQHQHGEAGLLNRKLFLHGAEGEHRLGPFSVEFAKEWFNRQAEKYRKQWEREQG